MTTVCEDEPSFEETYLTREEYAERQAICAACEHLTGTRCRKFCTCSGDLHGSRRRDIECPEGKW